MALKLIKQLDCGLVLFSTSIYDDNRGRFFEAFRVDELKQFGIKDDFLQDNFSISRKNVLRGMHFQWDKPQGKLIRTTKGEALIVEIDIRKNSPWFGQWFAFNLSEQNNYCLWIPPGFANGFLALSDELVVFYKCTAYYNPNAEGTILWDDNKIGINWGINFQPILSDKDKNAMKLEDWKESKYFQYLDYDKLVNENGI